MIRTKNSIKNQAVSHIYLYGDIVSEACYDSDVSPDRVRAMLKDTGGEVVVHISSFGGDAFAGIAIYNLLKDSGKKITTQIDSIGASSASIIAMAGEEIVFGTGAQIMIHNPSTCCWGDKADFEKTIASLDKCKDAIIEIYNTHAIEGVDYGALMSAETWANGEIAKTIFANIVTKEMQGKEAITNRFTARQQQFNNNINPQNSQQ